MSDSAAHMGYRTRPDQSRGCVARMKAGLWMGFTVGGIVGLAYSGVQAIRFGIRGGELMRTVGRHTINSGGSFGVFMLVAQAIRC